MSVNPACLKGYFHESMLAQPRKKDGDHLARRSPNLNDFYTKQPLTEPVDNNNNVLKISNRSSDVIANFE